jgi:hypothetical protein
VIRTIKETIIATIYIEMVVIGKKEVAYHSNEYI